MRRLRDNRRHILKVCVLRMILSALSPGASSRRSHWCMSNTGRCRHLIFFAGACSARYQIAYTGKIQTGENETALKGGFLLRENVLDISYCLLYS